MAEVAEESTHVWTHKARIAVFLSAMRHFRDTLQGEGIDVDYTELAAKPKAKEPGTLAAALAGRAANKTVQELVGAGRGDGGWSGKHGHGPA